MFVLNSLFLNNLLKLRLISLIHIGNHSRYWLYCLGLLIYLLLNILILIWLSNLFTTSVPHAVMVVIPDMSRVLYLICTGFVLKKTKHSTQWKRFQNPLAESIRLTTHICMTDHVPTLVKTLH